MPKPPRLQSKPEGVHPEQTPGTSPKGRFPPTDVDPQLIMLAVLVIDDRSCDAFDPVRSPRSVWRLSQAESINKKWECLDLEVPSPYMNDRRCSKGRLPFYRSLAFLEVSVSRGRTRPAKLCFRGAANYGFSHKPTSPIGSVSLYWLRISPSRCPDTLSNLICV